MAYRKWKPSRSAARTFAQTMADIDSFCRENAISQSKTGDSYYFTLNGINYRISNHSVEASYRNSGGAWHTEGRQEDTVYIHAGKTRIREIYTALKNGEKLDGRGNPLS